MALGTASISSALIVVTQDLFLDLQIRLLVHHAVAQDRAPRSNHCHPKSPHTLGTIELHYIAQVRVVHGLFVSALEMNYLGGHREPIVPSSSAQGCLYQVPGSQSACCVKAFQRVILNLQKC